MKVTSALKLDCEIEREDLAVLNCVLGVNCFLQFGQLKLGAPVSGSSLTKCSNV